MIPHLDLYGVAAIITFFWLAELGMGFYGKRSVRTGTDWWIELFSFWNLVGVVKPAIFLLGGYVFMCLLPDLEDRGSGWSLWYAFPFVILTDDLMQYWYHRMAHGWNWLWKLHRPHHTAREMGVLTSYRNAMLYYVLMPNIHWLTFCTHLGLSDAVALSIVFKQLVVTAAHSPTKWDRVLYRHQWLSPVAWVVERIISTPSTHFAHHGMSEEDGVSNPNGNFSNTFFFWDLLFGTARINRKYPEVFGVKDNPDEPWYVQVLYPLARSKDPESDLAD